MHEQTRAGSTYLALVKEDGVGRTLNGHVHIAIVHDDHGGFAAQLQRHALHVIDGLMTDQLAHFRGAGKGDLVHARVSRQSRTCAFATTRDHVDHTGGETSFQSQLGQTNGSQRCLFSRLQNHGTTGGHGRRNLPHRHQQREVPGHDSAHHTNRFLAGVSVVFHAGRKADGRREQFAIHLGGPASHVAQPLCAGRHFQAVGEEQQLAVVQGFQTSQLIRVGFNQISQTQQEALALSGQHLSPFALLQSLARSTHGQIHALSTGLGLVRNHLSRCGIVDGNRGPLRFSDGFAVNNHVFANRLALGLYVLPHSLSPHGIVDS